jgi:5,10-methylenetetrahydrofolate reductase
MKLTKKHKAAIKSYLRAVAASGITVALAIVGDVKPEYAVLLGALVAPLIKALDIKENDFGITEKL